MRRIGPEGDVSSAMTSMFCASLSLISGSRAFSTCSHRSHRGISAVATRTILLKMNLFLTVNCGGPAFSIAVSATKAGNPASCSVSADMHCSRSQGLLALLFCVFCFFSSNAFANAEGERRHFNASWTTHLPPVGPGYGVALLPEKDAPKIGDWVEPNAPRVLSVGFDTENPRPRGSNRTRWFNAQGNFYDRPQREVSLHWNGREVANRLCPVSLTSHLGHSVRLHIEYVPGGAELTLAVDGAAVYDRFFVAEAVPYRGRFQVGGASALALDTRWSGARFSGVTPVSVTAFSKALNDAKHHRVDSEAAFPETTDGIGRVVCTLTLGETPTGLDPWDRLGHIWIYDEEGEAFEVIRFITPYRKGWEWKVDVTDLLPLLKGRRKMQIECETYAQGWLVSVRFDLYPGRLEQVPYRVVNLWNGMFDVGNWDKTFADVVTPRTVPTDRQTIGAKTRITVTGHGQNEDNLGEFAPLWRRVHSGGRTWENTLWKTDVYLNPCRPQGGTWKFDRAGWAPGEAVLPWEIDLTPVMKPGSPLDIAYELQPYRKRTEKSAPARHSFSSQVILYQKG